MRRSITDRDINRFFASAPTDPSSVEASLITEARGRAEQLIECGYRSLGDYVRHQQRDIDAGRREAPETESDRNQAAIDRRTRLLGEVQLIRSEINQAFRSHA